MVLVPYAKKDQQQTRPDNKAVTTLKGQSKFSTSKASDSVWSDMMQDLSFLRDIPREENSCNLESNGTNFANSNEVRWGSYTSTSSEPKMKKRLNSDKQAGHIDDLIISILGSSENTQLDEQNCKRFMQVLESVNCLSNPHSGECVLKEAYLQDNDQNPLANENDLCLCPSWLKIVMKAFYFLNIYSAYLHVQRDKVTVTCLKESLDQLYKLGLQVGIADLEILSHLCPKVIG